MQRQKSQQHKLCEIIEFVLYPTEPIAPNQTLLFFLQELQEEMKSHLVIR